MNINTLAELEVRRRRLIIARAVVRVTATTVMLLVLYYGLPFDNNDRSPLLLLFLGGLGFLIALVAQLRAIRGADHPALRAAESLGVTIPLIIVVFAATYLKMSQ